MKKYNRQDFYVVHLGFIDDKEKLNYPEAVADTYRFVNMYKKNGYFALALKKDEYFIDLINGQIFGENTTFCVKEKKSLAEILLGESKITKREALLELIYCVPLFANELCLDYANKSSAEDSFNIKSNKSIKYPIEVLEAKLKEIGYQGNYSMTYDTRDFFQKKLNKIPIEKDLKSPSTKYSVNDFCLAVVSEKNLHGEIHTDDTYISADYEREYVTLFLKLPDGTLWDMLRDKIVNSNNGYLSCSILCQKGLADYSSLTEKITKAKALEEAKCYAEVFLNEYKSSLDCGAVNENFSRKRNSNQ